MDSDAQTEPTQAPGGAYAWMVWLTASLFYFYEFFLRVAPSVMIPELMSHFNITAAGLGTLAALYYYIYSPMQLAVGAWIDRWGGKLLLPAAVLVCALGSLLFAAGGLYVAGLGRLLMGMGSAFAFVGAIYVASNWFPAGRFAMLSGLTTMLGMVGAAAGQGPVSAVVNTFGWQRIWYYTAIAGLVLALIMFVLIPKRPKWAKHPHKHHRHHEHHQLDPQSMTQRIKRVASNGQTWIIGLFGGLIYVPTSVFAALWGVQYFETAYSMNDSVAASIVSMIFVGWIVGAPLAGWLSDRIGLRKPPMIVGATGVLVVAVIAIYGTGLAVWHLFVLMFLLGLFSGGQVVCFASAYENNPFNAKATALAVTNLLVMIWAALLQPAVGGILDRVGDSEPGQQNFTVHDYHSALAVVPLCVAISIVLSFFIRETHGKHPEEEAVPAGA